MRMQEVTEIFLLSPTEWPYCLDRGVRRGGRAGVGVGGSVV